MVHLSVMFLFSAILCCLVLFTIIYNSLITHAKTVTPSKNVVFLHYYTECTGTYFERI